MNRDLARLVGVYGFYYGFTALTCVFTYEESPTLLGKVFDFVGDNITRLFFKSISGLIISGVSIKAGDLAVKYFPIDRE